MHDMQLHYNTHCKENIGQSAAALRTRTVVDGTNIIWLVCSVYSNVFKEVQKKRWENPDHPQKKCQIFIISHSSGQMSTFVHTQYM